MEENYQEAKKDAKEMRREAKEREAVVDARALRMEERMNVNFFINTAFALAAFGVSVFMTMNK